MTIESAAQFFKKAMDEDKVRGEVAAALKGGGEPRAIAARVAAVGKTHGFEFTPDEALIVRTAVRQDAIEKRVLNEELGDDELAIVSGGFGPGTPLDMFSTFRNIQEDSKSYDSRQVNQFHGIKAAITTICPVPVLGGLAGAGIAGLFTDKNIMANDLKRTVSNVTSLFDGSVKW